MSADGARREGGAELTADARGKVLLSWSSGKDCAWALHVLRQAGANVTGLLVTLNEAFDRVSMHATRREVLEAQARAVGLPVWPVMLPWPCTEEECSRRVGAVMLDARDAGVTHVAFGDLFLEDVRKYREERLAGTGLQPVFPLWTGRSGTAKLARLMVRSGVKARVSSIDPRMIPPSFAGREYDERFLTDLPPEADLCGENGEFHTICCDGPMFGHPVPLVPGEVVEREGFWYADFRLAGDRPPCEAPAPTPAE